MSTLPVGIRSPLLYPNVTNSGDTKPAEIVATTPLGRDENGKNLVAYIVRTEEDVPAYKLPNSSNSNTPKKSFLSDAAVTALQQQTQSPKPKVEQRVPPKTENTSAQFIKPDDLLSRLEQSQVDQLRARNDAVRNDKTDLNDGDGNALLTSLIYNTGPDGRRYAVGVSAPLLTKQPSAEPEAGADDPTATLQGKAASAYRQSAYYNATDLRSGLLNKAI